MTEEKGLLKYETRASTYVSREARIRHAGRMYLQGFAVEEIADRFDVTIDTTQGWLNIIKEEWRKASLIDFNAAKLQELAKINNLEKTYWEEYQKSKESENSAGDHKFLKGVEWCIERRILLFGLKAPQKYQIDTLVTEMSYEQRLERINEILDTARERRTEQVD